MKEEGGGKREEKGGKREEGRPACAQVGCRYTPAGRLSAYLGIYS